MQSNGPQPTSSVSDWYPGIHLLNIMWFLRFRQYSTAETALQTPWADNVSCHIKRHQSQANVFEVLWYCDSPLLSFFFLPLFPFSIFIYFQLIYNIEPTSTSIELELEWNWFFPQVCSNSDTCDIVDQCSMFNVQPYVMFIFNTLFSDSLSPSSSTNIATAASHY